MTVRKLCFYCVFISQCLFGQDSIVNKLQDVVISDFYLKKNSKSQHVITINTAKIQQNRPTLTSLLNYNSTIYFKENGLGMVSSPSFRGATAQQTAVIWNGININSQLNGQTDFNTISTKNFDNIAIRAGGGSAIYGSSAIGGSVHLSNNMVFEGKITNDLQLEYGSFNTIGTFYNGKISSRKISAQIGFSRNRSQNNYEYVRTFNWKGEQQKNINGEFDNNNLNLNFGLKLNENHLIKLYSQTSNSNRNLSLISQTDTKSKYLENFGRNLLEYNGDFGKVNINFKNAFIVENYEYYQSILNNSFSSGKTESFVSKIDFGYQIGKNIKLNSVLDFNRAKGSGSSIDNKIRTIGAGIFSLTHQTKSWQNEISARKEITNAYKSPYLFSAGSAYSFTDFYKLKANISKNFRIPTFNDLYYAGAGGLGNPNLLPETAYQAEIGNVITIKNFRFTQNIYAIKTSNLISWVPIIGGNSTPKNTAKVLAYGSESEFNAKYKIQNHSIDFNVNYAYTISQNEETKKQLLYVPFHKLSSSFVYQFKKIEMNYQFLYNGFVYKLSDNNPNEIVKAYKISNIGLNYSLGKAEKYKLGFQVSNIFNQKYQSVEGRFMPGININTFINFNI